MGVRLDTCWIWIESRSGAGRYALPDRCPAADDVADRDDARGLAVGQGDWVPEAAMGHRLRRLLQGPGWGGEDDVGGGVGVGVLRVRALAEPHGVEDVALGQYADTGAVGIEDHGRAHPAGGHQGGGLAESVGGADGEDHRAHGVADEHGFAVTSWEPVCWCTGSQVHKWGSPQSP